MVFSGEQNLSHLACKFLCFFILVTLVEVYVVSHWTTTLSISMSYVKKWRRIRPSYKSYKPYLIEPVKISPDIQAELAIKLKHATDKKIILIYIPSFGVKNSINLDASTCGNCEVTYDRNKLSDERTGAVIFHHDALTAWNVPFVWKRNPQQLYIFSTMESTLSLLAMYNHVVDYLNFFSFNATMTYRRDSDFHAPYGDAKQLESIIKRNNKSSREILRDKKKTAVAVVSDCDYTPGAVIRLDLLKKLMDLDFGLDGYGSCFGNKTFTNNKPLRGFNGFIYDYKFYFAFENSYHCRDYITEKFFRNALESLAVPVVWGSRREEYEAICPPRSFIHFDDFSSLEELAEYIKYLDRNDTAYMEYFRWLYMDPKDLPQYGRVSHLCQVCRALHGINIDDLYSPKFNSSRPLFSNKIAQRIVPDTIQWLFGEEYPECVAKFWN